MTDVRLPTAAMALSQPARLAVVRAIGAMPADATTQAALEHLTTAALRVLGAAGALVTIVSSDGVEVLRAAGPSVPYRSGEHLAFSDTCCRRVVERGDTVVVPDLDADAEAAGMPVVTVRGVHAWCAVPLLVHDAVVGAVSVLERAPRAWTPADVEVLRLLSAAAARELELRQALRVATTAQASERDFAALAGRSPDGICRVGRDLRYEYVNAALLAQSGLASDVLTGTHIGGVAGDEPLTHRWLADVRAVLDSGTPFETVYEHAYLAGQPRRFEARFVPLLDAAGVATAVLVTSRDITLESQALHALRESEQRFRGLYHFSPVGVGQVGMDGRWLDANPRLLAMLGYTRAELRTLTPRDVTYADDVVLHERPEEGTIDWLAGPVTAEKRYRRRDGSVFWARVSTSLVQGRPGAPGYFIGTVEDVSREHEARAALAWQEQRLADAQRIAGVGSWTWDLRAGRTVWSTQMHRLTGIDPSAGVLDWPGYVAHLHPDDRETMRDNQDRHLAARDGAWEIEYRFVRADGTTRWFAERVEAEYDDSGEPLLLTGTCLDVTERTLALAAEATAREEADVERRRLAATMQALPVGVVLVDERGAVITRNQAMEEIWGGSHRASSLEDYARYRGRVVDTGEPIGHQQWALLRALLQGEIVRGEVVEIERLDGLGRATILNGAAPVRDASGRIVGAVAVASDLTQRLQLEQQLRQSQKMEALGQLAGGVAHDFNNILAAITGYAQLLRGELPAGSALANDADEIARAAGRGAAVTKQLLAFSRRQTLEMEVLDLRAVVRDMGGLLRPLLPASIVLELPPASPADDAAGGDGAGVWVRATRAQLEQVVLNLAVNARDAMPGGGQLALRVTAGQGAAQGMVVLAVADTGTGMPAAVRERVFEPFFTTKPVGQGTGLGLATVYGLVRQFGGDVSVDSAEGRGTTFTVLLPVASRLGATPEVPEAAAARGPRLRVLVVDDEPTIRSIADRILRRAGHEVTLAVDGAAALASLEAAARTGAGFDVVLSDAAMPRMGGRELALRIVAEWPGLPVVLMSGYAELSGATDAAGQPAAPPNVVAFVQKPFTVERLMEALGVACGRGT